jgi:hypothetical protein
MRFLTSEECVAWCQARGYATTQHPGYAVPTPCDPSGFELVAFIPPVDSGQKVYFGRELFSLLEPASEYLVWLGEWGVWPSSQHLPLVTTLRLAHGERRPLIEAPGFLATPPELDDALSFFLVALLFVWDCHVFSTSGQEALFVSHDENGWFGARSDFKVARVRSTLSGLLNASSA